MIFGIQSLKAVLRAMAYLAEQPIDNSQPLHVIVQQCGCSEGALTQLLSLCTQAGLLHVQHGRQGGFRLSRPLEYITVCEICEVLHGQMDILFCPCPHRRGNCDPQNCPVNAIWGSACQAMQRALRLTTIAELVHHIPRSKPVMQTVSLRPSGLRLIGGSPAIQRVREAIRNVAPTDVNVLLLGETGTGKTLIAQLIHQGSRRRGVPFIAVNCPAIPAPLLESELFGHRRGAYTGAVEDYKGAFQQAEGGTLYLDEIGDVPLELQAKLLGAVEACFKFLKKLVYTLDGRVEGWKNER